MTGRSARKTAADDRAAAGRHAAKTFAALGDPTRLGIVSRLGAQGPLSTVSLASTTQVSRQAIAKHLRALEEAGLVDGRRVGRERLWQLQRDRLAEIENYLMKIAHHWDEALGRLRDVVEDG